jgi:hypothetical protein
MFGILSDGKDAEWEQKCQRYASGMNYLLAKKEGVEGPGSVRFGYYKEDPNNDLSNEEYVLQVFTKSGEWRTVEAFSKFDKRHDKAQTLEKLRVMFEAVEMIREYHRYK